jgi:hypothetical protein
MTTMRKKSLYSAHPGLKMEQDSLARLPEKTGKSIEEWVKFIKQYGPTSESDRRAWLKAEQGITTNYAMLIASHSMGQRLVGENPEALVDTMYSGKKAALRPIHDALVSLVVKTIPEAKVCAGKTICPIYRRHVVAQIKPTTNTRIDFGFALKDAKPSGNLKSTGGFEKGDRITHAIAVTSLEAITPELTKWLVKAWEQDQ